MKLQKNDNIELTIDGMTAEGSGVGHYEGLAVFVSNSAVGDKIDCHIIKSKKNYAIGKINNVISSSKDRCESDCPVSNMCGGCSFRHITYQSELKIKYQRVKDAFNRIGHLDIIPSPIIGADDVNNYRNKAQYPVGFDKDIKIGFYAPYSHRIIDCKNCNLAPKEFTTAVNIFNTFLKDNNISIYNEKTHTGLFRHIYLRKAQSTGEILACAVINGTSLPHKEKLLDMLRESLNGLKGFLLNFNTKDTNVILSDRYEIVWGQNYITDILCGLKFKISPQSFYQVNATQAEKLYLKAKEYAQISKDDTLLDLYCGTGTIGLTMANEVKKVIGVEIVPNAIKDAKENAKINNICNATFICDDATGCAKKLKEEEIKPDIILVDPPRKGLTNDLILTISKMNPKRVVYISCDPATLARDCKLFDDIGYKTTKVTPVDMFPRTSHVECVVLMSRSDC